MRIDKQYILRQIDGDYLIIPTGKTTLEFNGLITVNEQGAFLWQQLTQECSEEELVDSMLEEYEIDRETARTDVAEFVEILRKAGILK